MPRYRLTLEYDGRGFVGWQRQENGLGVQQALEQAIEQFTGERIKVYGAGRTDSGVHALAQVAHFDLQRETPTDRIRDAINAQVRPHPVSVLEATTAADDFNARTSASGRAYLYRIVNRRAPVTFKHGLVWWVPVALDAEAMAEAAQTLIGRHDFSTFRARECQASSPTKTLDEVTVATDGEEILFTVRARSFLHHQVRNIVGTLKWVGEGKWTAADVKAALEACDRRAGGPTAPADGLYLTGVSY